MNNKIIYIVTNSYDNDNEYFIIGVFEDKELAEEYARQNQADVKEYRIKTDADLILPKGYLNYEVVMKEDGDVERANITSPEFNVDYDEVDFRYKNVDKPYHFKNGNKCFYIATNMGREGAIKIANERRAQLIATNKWPKKGEKIKI